MIVAFVKIRFTQLNSGLASGLILFCPVIFGSFPGKIRRRTGAVYCCFVQGKVTEPNPMSRFRAET